MKNCGCLIVLLFFLYILGCCTFGDAHKYGTERHAMRDTNGAYGFGKYFLVDSVKDLDFTIFLSKEGHFFLVPNSSVNLVTDKVCESTIFQIPGAGLFRWEYILGEYLPKEAFMRSAESIFFGDYVEYAALKESVRLQNQYIHINTFTRNFDIVRYELKPVMLYKMLIRGDAYQTSLIPEAFRNYYVVHSGSGHDKAKLWERKGFERVPFIYPFAYYPLYIPLFKENACNKWSIDSINKDL